MRILCGLIFCVTYALVKVELFDEPVEIKIPLAGSIEKYRATS